MSRKIRSAAQQKGKSGKPLTTHPCFGYVKDPKDKTHWLVDPEAADTVRRIFELAASGMSQLKICRTMVQEKRFTPGYYRAQREPDGFGKRYANSQPYHWNHKMVNKIVQRQEYLGKTVNFKTCHPEYRSRQMMDKFGIDMPENLIEQFLRTGTANISHELLDQLTAIVRGYVTGLFDALRVHGYDARLMKFIVMGGGGCLVKNFGKYDPGSIILVDDLHASAKGYEYMAQGLIWHRERMARKAGD